MGDVIDIKTRKRPLFNDELREKLNEGVKEHTSKPEETIDRVEDVICTHIVLTAKQLGEKFANFLFKKITKS
jgi:hypothetical protein